MAAPDNDDEMDYIFRNVENELDRINKAQKRTTKRTEQSFIDWLGEAIATVGKAIGYVVVAPIKAISSFWKWLFGGQ